MIFIQKIEQKYLYFCIQLKEILNCLQKAKNGLAATYCWTISFSGPNLTLFYRNFHFFDHKINFQFLQINFG
jgi:hypothetical protein